MLCARWNGNRLVVQHNRIGMCNAHCAFISCLFLSCFNLNHQTNKKTLSLFVFVHCAMKKNQRRFHLWALKMSNTRIIVLLLSDIWVQFRTSWISPHKKEFIGASVLKIERKKLRLISSLFFGFQVNRSIRIIESKACNLIIIVSIIDEPSSSDHLILEYQ